MTYQEIKDIPIYFILAKGRSGTTLLQTMIDAHPNTSAPTESRFLVHFYNKYGNTKNWTEKIKKAFFEDIIIEQKIALFWNLNIDKFKKLLTTIPEDASYGMICKAVYLSFNSIFIKEHTTCIIDKNPVYSWLIPILLEIVPDAKFIHLIRDSRACVNSTIKFRTKHANSVAKSWSTNNYYIEKFKSIHKKNFVTIHYEDMIRTPDITLTKVCKFLNLDYKIQMNQYHKQVQASIDEYLVDGSSEEINNVRRAGFENIHKNLVKPLDPSRIDSWKSNLSSKLVEQISRITGSLLYQYGYETHVPSPNSSPLFYVKLWTIYKTQLYYRLPIWLRELKSKPELVFLENGK